MEIENPAYAGRCPISRFTAPNVLDSQRDKSTEWEEGGLQTTTELYSDSFFYL